MCLACKNAPRPTYANVYNEMYGASDLNSFVAKRLHEACCLRTRLALARHLATIARTQSIFEKLSSSSLVRIARHRRQAEGRSATRLVALQDRVAKHVWRPGGALPMRDARRLVAAFSDQI